MYVEQKVSTTYIGNKLSISPTTVTCYLRQSGIQIQKARYKFNESYFKKIDTEDKAYFLGLIYADGSINNKRNTCTIKLVSTDDYILKKLNTLIECNKPLSYAKEELIRGTKYIGKQRTILNISSKRVISDLEKAGVFSNKSQTIIFPDDDIVSKELKWDFIRGYFDGDGSISITENRPNISFAGNYEFLYSLSEFINEYINLKPLPYKHMTANCYYIKINKLDRVIKFCNLLYNNRDCTKLHRKYEKYNNYLNGTYYKKIKDYLNKHGKVHGINKHTKF